MINPFKIKHMNSNEIINKIRDAQRNLNVLVINYVKLNGEKSTRRLECYEIKIEAYGVYLYAYDLTDGKEKHIKKFLVDRIEGVEIDKSAKFNPRWPVKLS